MRYYIVSAKYIENFKVLIEFEDGKKGEIDFSNEFDGPIFKPLKNIGFFKKFNIEGKTLHWQNGADFAPEYLYELIVNKGNVA